MGTTKQAGWRRVGLMGKSKGNGVRDNDDFGITEFEKPCINKESYLILVKGVQLYIDKV